MRKLANALEALDSQGYILEALDLLEHPEDSLTSLVGSFSIPMMGRRKRQSRMQVVRLEPKPGYDPHSFRGSGTFDLHTDSCWIAEPPRYATLLCVVPDEDNGGSSLYVDGYEVLENLEADQRAELERRKVVFESHRDAPKRSTFEAPIAERIGSTTRIRFRRDLIAGTIFEPLQAFIDTAARMVRKVSLASGDVLVCDNFRMLHGRTALSRGLDSKRLFMRVHSDRA